MQGVRAKAEFVKDRSELMFGVSQTHYATMRGHAYVVKSPSSDVTLVCCLSGDFMHTLHNLRCLPFRSLGWGGLAIQFYHRCQQSMFAPVDKLASAYTAHNLAALPALSDHVAGTWAYFATCKTPRRLFCAVHRRNSRARLFEFRSHSRIRCFVGAA